MKKFLLSLTAFLILSHIPLAASRREKQTWDSQPYKYEMRFGYGIPSETAVDTYLSNPLYSSGGRLSSIYSPKRGSLYSTGAFTAEFGLNFRRWFTLAFQASVSGVWNDTLTPDGEEIISRTSGAVINLAPQARFNWIKCSAFRLYSSVGYGLTLVAYGDRCDFKPSFQFIPIGITAGRSVFFFAELGGGVDCNFVGGHMGIGYRF